MQNPGPQTLLLYLGIAKHWPRKTGTHWLAVLFKRNKINQCGACPSQKHCFLCQALQNPGQIPKPRSNSKTPVKFPKPRSNSKTPVKTGPGPGSISPRPSPGPAERLGPGPAPLRDGVSAAWQARKCCILHAFGAARHPYDHANALFI